MKVIEKFTIYQFVQSKIGTKLRELKVMQERLTKEHDDYKQEKSFVG